MKRKTTFGSLFVFCALTASFQFSAQTKREVGKIIAGYDTNKISKLQKEELSKSKIEKAFALDYARKKGIPVTKKLADGGFAELQRIENGTPIYYRTFNVDAARSTRTNHLNTNGSLGLNLNGENMTAYVWDGGHARVTHQEYDGAGGQDRVSVEDAATEGGTRLNFHAAHVTGTICASGVVANAKGMAPQSRVRGYMWNNDLAEATAAVANGMLVSNHSYGYVADNLEDYYFGGYITKSRDWDNLMFNAPNYLMVVAAGNDGQSRANDTPLNPGFPQFDKLTGHSTCKNNLVVANAEDANIDADGNLVNVRINSSSSQGPTDDLRIKPDITGNGTEVFSTYQNANNAYESITGTSMASPNVAGSLLLLQQHYNNVNRSFMRAATLKGLALHTADDAGMVGPDANFGWGLMNAKKAAQVISTNGNQSRIQELTLQQGQTYEINVSSDGLTPLLASISWTDPAGVANRLLNSNLATLVNDLDIRVIQNGNTFLPWRLTGVNTNERGDNTKDNFERIEVPNARGVYTIRITHKGNLTGNSQNYSLIISGITNNQVGCNATVPQGLVLSATTSNSTSLNWNVVANASYEVQYRALNSVAWTTVASANNLLAIRNLQPSTTYQVRVRSLCANGSVSEYSAVSTVTTQAVAGVDTIAPTVPLNLRAFGTTSTETNLIWDASNDNVAVTGYNVYNGQVLIGQTQNQSFNIQRLSPNTNYVFSVRAKDAAGNLSVASNTINVRTNVGALVYCNSAANSASNERIGKVEIGTISNASQGTNGYEDFTALSTDLGLSSVQSITITPTWKSTAYNEAYAVFIDYNQDGDFSDQGELVWSRTATNAKSVKGYFFVPSQAQLGKTRLRVSMKFNNIPTACERFSFGQVEDYTVNITTRNAVLADSDSGSDSEIVIYPNPADSFLRVDGLIMDEASYSIVNQQGQILRSGKLDQEINVEDLPAGLYILELKDSKKSTTKKFVKN